MAERLDPPYTSPAVMMWETGKAKPRLDTLRQLASMFGVSVEELLGEQPLHDV